MVAQLDILDGSGLLIGLSHDDRVYNMIAALSLLRYIQGKVTQYTESLLLGSFLESQEFSISSVVLEYYMKTIISYSDPSAPSRYLSCAVYAVFNLILPDHQLQMGWAILDVFVNGFDNLPLEWRRTFTEGFFTQSRQPLARPRGDEDSTPESELEGVLTCEYFHETEREDKFTDLDFTGLDWMAVAWVQGNDRRSTNGGGTIMWFEYPCSHRGIRLAGTLQTARSRSILPNRPNRPQALRVYSVVQ